MTLVARPMGPAAFLIVLLITFSASAADAPSSKQEEKPRAKTETSAVKRSPSSAIENPAMKSPISLQPSWYTDPSALSAPVKKGDVPRSMPVKATEAPSVSNESPSESFQRRQYLKN